MARAVAEASPERQKTETLLFELARRAGRWTARGVLAVFRDPLYRVFVSGGAGVLSGLLAWLSGGGLLRAVALIFGATLALLVIVFLILSGRWDSARRREAAYEAEANRRALEGGGLEHARNLRGFVRDSWAGGSDPLVLGDPVLTTLLETERERFAQRFRGGVALVVAREGADAYLVTNTAGRLDAQLREGLECSKDDRAFEEVALSFANHHYAVRFTVARYRYVLVALSDEDFSPREKLALEFAGFDFQALALSRPGPTKGPTPPRHPAERQLERGQFE